MSAILMPASLVPAVATLGTLAHKVSRSNSAHADKRFAACGSLGAQPDDAGTFTPHLPETLNLFARHGWTCYDAA
jgi:hypothetical protein